MPHVSRPAPRRSLRRRRLALALPAGLAALLFSTVPAFACGGLIGPNGAVNLLRTSTLAAYADGVEHYVTAFEFAGGGGAFGSITPLPGIPTTVERGGDWTLQRLALETEPRPAQAFDAAGGSPAASRAEVLLETRVDALDLTVLRGGGDEVGAWAKEHGFRLPPDAPEVLDFYARRSPIFLAASFDPTAAAERGQQLGDGTPVHLTIPTDDPWVPLRILGLGKTGTERVEADVYLLTEHRPTLLPAPDAGRGLALAHDAPATDSLLGDLRSDAGMAWVPQRSWLTKVRIDALATDLTFDLAVDETGRSRPSAVAAGLELDGDATRAPTGEEMLALVSVLVLTAFGSLTRVLRW